MKIRLIAPLIGILIFTIGLLLWFGVKLANEEQRRVQDGVRAVYRNRLVDVEGRLQETVSDIARETKRALDSYQTPVEAWARGVSRKHRFIRQIFVLDKDRRFVFPHSSTTLSEREQRALLRTRSIWNGGRDFGEGGEGKSGLSSSEGWYTWFWDTGLQFLYWQVRGSGELVCAELDRVAMFAELIGTLPESESDQNGSANGLVVLRNERQRELYRWGQDRAVDGVDPDVSLPLTDPFGSWGIDLYLSEETRAGRFGASVRFNVFSGVVLATGLILGLAFLAYREYSRELREAASRLTFVNQVSHELKTPLTNIRLYAEILDDQVEDENLGARESLTIVQSECRRLSRLIKNVLSFARSGGEGRELKLTETSVDQVIESVIAGFLPSLSANQIEVKFEAGVEVDVMLDRDVLEQVLGNLIANVEKYASSGKSLHLRSGLSGSELVIDVRDRGPGIPSESAARVFEAFFRLSNRVSDGVAGTGIGLTIARDLARLHGGDLGLKASGEGAWFRMRFVVTRTEDSV